MAGNGARRGVSLFRATGIALPPAPDRSISNGRPAAGVEPRSGEAPPRDTVSTATSTIRPDAHSVALAPFASVRLLADPITVALDALASRPHLLPRERFCYSQNAAVRWNFSQRRTTRGSTSVVVPAAAKPSTSPAA